MGTTTQFVDRAGLGVATALLALAAAHGCSGSSSAPAPLAVSAKPLSAAGAPSTYGNAGEPPEVIAASREWPTANRDYAGTRATFTANIASSNVATLAPVWSYAFPKVDSGYVGIATSSALVLDGRLYYQDQLCNVSVLDAQTGAPIWKTEYNAPCGAPNGLAVGWGKVFAAASDKTFVALDLASGTELWRAPIEVPQNGGIGIQPIAYGNLVYLSTVPVNAGGQYVGGVNGTLYALDQADGKVVWSLKTIADETLWGNPQVNSGGGAWFPPTIDGARGRIYWGIGNPGPFPGTAEYPLGSSRPGDNLYTNSVLALDAVSGRLDWYFQEKPHDLFDLDFQNPPIVAGDLIIGSGKTGTVVALDAKQGTLVWRTPVGRHENDQLQQFDEAGVDVYPGSLAGVIEPIAYAEGTLYEPDVIWGRHYTPSGAATDMIGASGLGELVALNVADGSLRWKVDLPATPFGSVTVVNDLVFTSTLNGLVLAFDRNSGAELWRFQGPNGINAPITAVGDQLFIPYGIGPGVAQLIALRLR